jgi:hypothetical protein
MKTTKNISSKKTYLNPEIVYIQLDSEISLSLESAPPDGPGELLLVTSETENSQCQPMPV